MIRTANRTLAFAAALALAGSLVAVSQEAKRSVQSGVFTSEQAKRGEKVFETSCRACHQPAEFGDGAYLESWAGLPVHDLVEHIRSTMPQDSPGSLQRKDYVDVAAFFLKINGVPEGASEMDLASLKDIVFEGPYRPSGASR